MYCTGFVLCPIDQAYTYTGIILVYNDLCTRNRRIRGAQLPSTYARSGRTRYWLPMTHVGLGPLVLAASETSGRSTCPCSGQGFQIWQFSSILSVFRFFYLSGRIPIWSCIWQEFGFFFLIYLLEFQFGCSFGVNLAVFMAASGG